MKTTALSALFLAVLAPLTAIAANDDPLQSQQWIPPLQKAEQNHGNSSTRIWFAAPDSEERQVEYAHTTEFYAVKALEFRDLHGWSLEDEMRWVYENMKPGESTNLIVLAATEAYLAAQFIPDNPETGYLPGNGRFAWNDGDGDSAGRLLSRFTPDGDERTDALCSEAVRYAGLAIEYKSRGWSLEQEMAWVLAHMANEEFTNLVILIATLAYLEADFVPAEAVQTRMQLRCLNQLPATSVPPLDPEVLEDF